MLFYVCNSVSVCIDAPFQQFQFEKTTNHISDCEWLPELALLRHLASHWRLWGVPTADIRLPQNKEAEKSEPSPEMSLKMLFAYYGWMRACQGEVKCFLLQLSWPLTSSSPTAPPLIIPQSVRTLNIVYSINQTPCLVSIVPARRIPSAFLFFPQRD